MNGKVPEIARPTADDLWLFAAGRHERLWEALGAHPGERAGVPGTNFAVWAPHARGVWVVGEWTGWESGAHPMNRLDAGVWAGFVPDVGSGVPYKFEIEGSDGRRVQRIDPMALFSEHSAGMASIVFQSSHEWRDDEWMSRRGSADPVRDRMSVYEVHLGSWRRHADGTFLTYRELAGQLAEHVAGLGFTHVELMPPAEHPYEPSWGYQVTGFYAPTSRFGNPDDFRWLVDHLHQNGIGVIIDWVPAHFPRDEWGLARYDGRPLYEDPDPRRGEHPDWGTLVFDYGRLEVKNFLVANALFWLGDLHVDGLRVDAVASMLYLDYSRGHGQWAPNVHGGNENLEAVAFLQELNTTVHRVHPGVVTIAEESTAWEGVTRPVDRGGLGFTHKWNMGWMHDSLEYWSTDPIYRPWHHNQLTFGLTYAWAEHFILPLSHDEVVHLKRSLLGKMPGVTDHERFANLRSLYAWMWAHPGQPLLFMGGELAETREWSHDRSLDWALLDDPGHASVAELVAALNAVAAEQPALYVGDGDPAGFAWLDVDNAGQSILAFERVVPGGDGVVVCVANLAGAPRGGYRLGLGRAGRWRAALTTDDTRFGGHGGWEDDLEAETIPWQGRSHSAVLGLPPLSVTYLRSPLVPDVASDGPALVIHGHFYQPPREDPWTGEVPEQPGAAPFHDWNERITAECYGPNTAVPVTHGDGSVETVSTFDRLSFDMGPTLLSWLERHHPQVYGAILDSDRRHGRALAQGYAHSILPLCNDRDLRTQVRWGVADFRHRFGRPPEGMWLPETAVSERVLAVLAEEGVRFTIVAPYQLRSVRPLDGATGWHDLIDDVGHQTEPVVTDRPYRWQHPAREDLELDLVVYDGELAHRLAFSEPSSDAVVTMVCEHGAAPGAIVAAATDGETFGHHHRGAEHVLARTFFVVAPQRGITTPRLVDLIADRPPTHQARVRTSAWSCAHGVGRWVNDCGCHTGGQEGWTQAWRAPLRTALDLLRDWGTGVMERRGRALLHHPWLARDAYIAVVVGARGAEDFASEHVAGDRDAALTLLEAQRFGMLMYTSCGWFFNDLAGIETVQVLRYAARAMDLYREVGEQPPVDAFLDVLGQASSNDPAAGDGRHIWTDQVDGARPH